MRALLYARYSTTLQSSLSIDDQLRVCADLCAREGWAVAGQHCDAAISGAVRNRPGLNMLLADVGDGDIIVAESLDRLSRDQEDIAAIFKRVRYAGARIWTLSEGEVGELHIGLRGTMAAMVRKDTADKVRRGLTGRALAGSNPGGMAYGYRKVGRLDARGELVRGLREIDPAKAAIVVRIFTEHAQGRSTRAIAQGLNRDGIPSPSGGTWRASTIGGGHRRGDGILNNELYRGRQRYNRTRRVYRPGDHKREVRLNSREEWLFADVSELRIVGDELWEAAQAQRRRYSGERLGGRPERARRPKRLLSGKAVCGLCGGGWTVIGVDRWGCGRHRDGRGCANGRTITTRELERRVLHGLSQRLLDPELVRIFVEEWRAERARLASGARRELTQLERRKGAAERKIARLVSAIAEGLGEFADIRRALLAAREELERANSELAALEAEKVVALHPGLAHDYRRRVADLTATLAGGDQDEARSVLRGLIERITVLPNARGRGVAIEVTGLLTGLVDLAAGESVSERMLTLVPLERLGRNHTWLRAAC